MEGRKRQERAMAMEATISSTASARPGLASVIVAATIGNVLEWFDFLVYGFFAVTIAEVFFPVGNSTVSLLITFGTFGLAYLVRPLGAIIVGTYTDRAGRKAGLTLSIGLMLIGTTLMVVTPGYATIGLAADREALQQARDGDDDRRAPAARLLGRRRVRQRGHLSGR